MISHHCYDTIQSVKIHYIEGNKTVFSIEIPMNAAHRNFQNFYRQLVWLWRNFAMGGLSKTMMK